MELPDAATALVQGASRGLGLAFVRRLLDDDRFARVIATSRHPERSGELAELRKAHEGRLVCLPLDVTNPGSVAAAADEAAEHTDRLHLLLNVAGVLHADDGLGPEKKLEQVEADALARVFAVNAFGPLLVARHFLPLLRHDEPAVLANLSARVGSIGDNRAGGWYAYRASKAAQNMFTRTLAIELGRRARNVVVVALHPGTVDTDLSRPFQGSVPDGKLFAPDRAARQLLDVVASLGPDDSGSFLAWDRQPIPW